MLYNVVSKQERHVNMEELKQRIISDGRICHGGILKVDSFLNHQIDTKLVDRMGADFYEHFKAYGITKILTIEASGIGISCLTARYFDVPVVFAKKSEAKNMSEEVYTSEVFSFTKGRSFTVRVDKTYISADDRVLVIDDFLANGQALLGLFDIVRQAGAQLCGAGICIEKAFQPGGDTIRGMGIDLHSLAVVDVDEQDRLIFVDK